MVVAVWEAQLWSWQDETEISGSSQPSWQGNIWFETRKKKRKKTQILEFNMPIFIPYADTDSTTKL